MAESDEIDTAIQAVVNSGDEDEQDETIQQLMDAVVDADEATKQEAIETVSMKTRKTKREANDLLKDAETNRTRDLVTVREIEKIVPAGEADEVRYRFHVHIQNSGEGVVNLSSEDLMTPRSFRQRVFELSNTLVEIPEWDQTLNQWMNRAEIVEKEQEPITTEHALVQAVIDRIRGMAVTTDYDEFKMRSLNSVFYQPDEGVALVAGDVVDDVRQDMRGEVEMRRARSLLDPFIADNSKPVQTDDGMFRVWQFSADALTELADVDLDGPIEDDGEVEP